MKSVNARLFLLSLILLINGIAKAQESSHYNNPKNKELTMSPVQRNKDVILKLYEQCLNKRNMELLQNLISEDYIGLQGVKGAAGFNKTITSLIKAFPDARWKVEELIGEGNKVVVRQQLKGTQTGQFQHIAPTGKSVTNDGTVIYELKDGKVINIQVLTDRLGFLQQLDVLPFDLTLLPNKKVFKGKVSFIDKFFVPAAAKQEFYERMSINRNFIKKLPGFIEDVAYEYADNAGNLICITIAQWENREALDKAKEVVQAEYKKQGFDAAEMFKRSHIVADRGVYTEIEGH
jgi:predicted ester cyclase